MKTKMIEREILDRLATGEAAFGGSSRPLLKISNEYPGLWLEHLYDSVAYARLYPEKIYLAENAVNAFIDFAAPDGQLPYVIRDAEDESSRHGFSQVQECLSFGTIVLLTYELGKNRTLLERGYAATRRWVGWLARHRMTRGTGLVEMFVGFDTGHDNSPRVLDLGQPRRYAVDGVPMNARVMPPDDGITPVLALDMSCNYYGNLTALAKMAQILGEDGSDFASAAQETKKQILSRLYDPDTDFFYDLDRQGRFRRILSVEILHLFLEGVLDPKTDAELIARLAKKYIFNEKHFFTPYPFPSISVSDPTWKKHTAQNCWGYYTESLTVLRATLWMDKYGFSDKFDHIASRYLAAWTRAYGTVNLGQELDPITGAPSPCSEWYSAGMIAYLCCLDRKKTK